ncbi:MAG TPA: hypothetical protein DIU15_11605 [Deltaproteobacteria bacterium]|nr:hypothetical protein [Deltaproteobacteria bacterium]|tara:strand:- start:247 stop:522 length:276 start_codon:yes stop_codon:yes gene_type:complete
MRLHSVLIAALVLLWAGTALETPTRVAQQGRLLESVGQPLSGADSLVGLGPSFTCIYPNPITGNFPGGYSSNGVHDSANSSNQMRYRLLCF